MKKMLAALLLIAVSSLANAQMDTDIDNNGQWIYGPGVTDRDLEHDARWNSDEQDTVGDMGDDRQWNFSLGDIDRDLDNDGERASSHAAPFRFTILAVSGVPTVMLKIGI